ncbi:MAG: hypothetical protein HKN47_02285 [Pirellulaceae bacterium]|nr:hypothetical protein [Pirellulaceae bacterium]
MSIYRSRPQTMDDLVISNSQSDGALRIAVVGCGPKGMYCLERLVSQLSPIPDSVRVHVTIFDAADYFGAGNVYHPDQPDFLRLNFAAKHVNAWMTEPSGPNNGSSLGGGQLCNAKTVAGPSLLQWLAIHEPTLADGEAYVPRSVVGRYLHECYQRVRAELSQLADVCEDRRSVKQITRYGDRWLLTVDQDSFLYDEVLVTVGHEGWRAAPHVETIVPTRTIPSVYPVQPQLSPRKIPPQCTVAVQGFGLTWIDAALALTEGRGGTFDRHDGEWTYQPSGTEPNRIIPFSRSGRPMLAKPTDTLVRAPKNLDEVWRLHCKQIHDIDDREIDFEKVLWPIICQAANDALELCDASAPRVEQWFDDWLTNDWDHMAIVQAMQHSCEVAAGQRDVDPPWALGQAWRSLYCELVPAISHGRMKSESWVVFRRIAAEMERIAFGPPGENLRRILALVRANIVDFRFLQSPHVCRNLNSLQISNNGRTAIADRVIHAVIPTPLNASLGGPIASLVMQGLVMRNKATGAIDIDPAGNPIDPDGNPLPGLAVIGRPTEGCVLGNDTLSRKLHSHPHHWAGRVAKRCANWRGKS